MGSFIHYCKYCNAKLNVDDAWMGKTMKCPACGKKINFPQADNEFESAAGSSDLSDVPSAPDLQLPHALMRHFPKPCEQGHLNNEPHHTLPQQL